MASTTYQIGEVVDRVGFSVRTVRYYEEVGLVTPSHRTAQLHAAEQLAARLERELDQDHA